jgi:hypothetical protein
MAGDAALAGYFRAGFVKAVGCCERGGSGKLGWPKTVERGVAGCGVGDCERDEWLRGEGESLFLGDVWLQPDFLLRWVSAGSADSGLAFELNHWPQDGMAGQCG